MHVELKNRLRDESVNVPFSVSIFFVAVARNFFKRDKKARRKNCQNCNKDEPKSTSVSRVQFDFIFATLST